MVLDLVEGCELVMNGESWQVERLEPYWGKIVLRPVGDPGGPVRQYVREKYGEDVVIPSSETLRLVWREWFGPGGSRQRYARSAAVAEANATGEHVVIHRPGQVVALDTTPLPVLVRENVFRNRSRRT